MSFAHVQKYLVLSALLWKIVRPFAVAVAKNTRNSTVDDDLIEAVDVVLGAKPVEFENVLPDGKGKEVA